jgi:large subunit ribosomal protein L17
MKHRIGYNRLGRKASHRKALVKNMVTQLYRHERIRTTKSKALEVRRRAEKLITRAKEDSVHNRRVVAKLIQDKAILAKLFTDIAPGFVDRPGGYTRILKLGFRKGDAAEMVLLELVGREDDAPKPKKPSKAAKKEEPVVTDVKEPVKAADEPKDAGEASDTEVETNVAADAPVIEEADVQAATEVETEVEQDAAEASEENTETEAEKSEEPEKTDVDTEDKKE